MRSAAWIVFLKEVRENLRDKRTVTNALLVGPLLGPLLFGGLISLIMSREVDKAEKPLAVPVIGSEHAPNLLTFLKQNGMESKSAPADAEKAIRDQDEDVILRIPPGYAEAWRKGETAQVELLFDRSQREANSTRERVSNLLEGYSRQNASLRIAARGLHPALITPLAVAERDLSTAQSRSALLFAMLPYFLIMTAFMGGMYLAIDTTAGERERQSLEPLLVNPVARWKIMAGKLAATFAFAMLSLLLSLLAFNLSGNLIPMDKLGMTLDMGPRFIGFALLVAVPLVLLASALQTLIAAFAKSYREAQTYLSLLLMVPMLPAVILAVLPVKSQLWMSAVPLLAQHLMVMKLVRGEPLLLNEVGLCLVTGTIIALIACWLTARIYQRESLAISA